MPDDLTSEQRAELEADLCALQVDLAEMIELSKEGSRPVDLDQPIGRISRMDAIQQQQMAESNRRGYKLRLRRVEAALSAMGNAEYGLCHACEEPIAFRRLKAVPESRMCIQCKSAQEQRG